MKQLEVQIMGQSYVLSCPDGGEARLLEAVARVDTAMCRIRDAGKLRARDRIAVLAALNLAYEIADRPPPSPAAEPAEDHAGAADRERLQRLIERIDTQLARDQQLL